MLYKRNQEISDRQIHRFSISRLLEMTSDTVPESKISRQKARIARKQLK